MELAVNTFGMGTLLRKKFYSTIHTLKKHGITGMEPCILFLEEDSRLEKILSVGKKAVDKLGGVWLTQEAGIKIAEVRKEGLRVEGAHLFDKDLTNGKVLQAAEFAREHGLTYYVLSYMAEKIEDVAKYIPVLRYACRKFKEYGVHLLLHNHAVDLKETEGLCVFDFLLENVPDLEVQIDLGWAVHAGRDCVDMMERYKERIRLLHFKDMWMGGTSDKPHFSAVGEGGLPLADIMEKAKELNLIAPEYIIDQDESEGDLMQDILVGAEHIRMWEHFVPKIRAHWDGKIPLSLMSFPMSGEIMKHAMSFDEVCEMAAAQGIHHIDMMELEILLYGKKKVMAGLRKYDIHLNCLIATVPMGTMKEFLIRTLIRKHLRTAAQFRCRKLMLIPMPQFEKQPAEETAREERWNRCVRFLREAVAEGKKMNITVCVEDTPTCEVPLCSTRDCKAMLEAVPGLRLVFDTANMIPRGDDPMEFYEELKPYICHVHMKDVRYTEEETTDRCASGKYLACCPWGEGIIPIKSLYERLVQDGYRGLCALEYVSPQQKGVMANDRQIGKFLDYLSSSCLDASRE